MQQVKPRQILCRLPPSCFHLVEPHTLRAQPVAEGTLVLVEDAALAVPRGVVGAAKDLYGLADTVTGDALPDWTDSPFGESSSTVGGLIESAENLAVVGPARQCSATSAPPHAPLD